MMMMRLSQRRLLVNVGRIIPSRPYMENEIGEYAQDVIVGVLAYRYPCISISPPAFF